MKRFCNNSIDDFEFKKVNREDMCAWQYVINFETVEEYKQVFDFANKNNLRFLYKLTFNWAKDFWLEKIIEDYNDVTFYAYIITQTSDLKVLLNIFNNVDNDYLYKILKIYIEKINYFHINKENFSQDNWYKYWENIGNEFDNWIKKISEINYKIF